MMATENSSTFWWTWSSPVGDLLLIADERGLRGLHFQDGPHPLRPADGWRRERGYFQAVMQQLEAYFAGHLRHFDIPLSLQGTAFQLAVWAALQQIPYGMVASYGDIAGHIGSPKAFRAVGAANGLNPVSIIVPCHRVIGKNGHLVGFGGGLPIKRALLALEHAQTGTGDGPMGRTWVGGKRYSMGPLTDGADLLVRSDTEESMA